VSEVKHRIDHSPCWRDLLKIKDLYLASRKIMIGTGGLARFWKDTDFYERPLSETFPELYNICNDHNILVNNWICLHPSNCNCRNQLW
jgi:hypothetical protein